MSYSYEVDGAMKKLLRLRMPKPSNMHAHLRTGFLLRAVAADTMRPWKHLLAMPNTGPITTIGEMLDYRDELTRIKVEAGLETNIIMTLYLTSALTPAVVEQMAGLEFPCAVKYYPPHKGATTGSGHGVALDDARETLRAMEANGIRLLGHFESVEDQRGNELPHEEREDYFMIHEFARLRDGYPDLNITIEHATTARAINRVYEDPSGKTICGITPQAMILVRDDLDSLTWGTHAKCMPIAKRPEDREAVLEFAISGDRRAHLGDDTAPHPSKSKLVPFGKAASGCYLPHSLALYAMVFHEQDALENFPAFACYNGPDAWGLPRPGEDEEVVLVRDIERDIPSPKPIPEGDDVVIPFGWSEGEDALHPGLVLTEA